MTRNDIATIRIGQTGLYAWDKSLPVVEVHDIREVLVGRDRGKIFRYVKVASATGNATIGFIVKEGGAITMN